VRDAPHHCPNSLFLVGMNTPKDGIPETSMSTRCPKGTFRLGNLRKIQLSTYPPSICQSSCGADLPVCQSSRSGAHVWPARRAYWSRLPDIPCTTPRPAGMPCGAFFHPASPPFSPQTAWRNALRRALRRRPPAKCSTTPRKRQLWCFLRPLAQAASWP
jgi:hypothetical protein